MDCLSLKVLSSSSSRRRSRKTLGRGHNIALTCLRKIPFEAEQVSCTEKLFLQAPAVTNSSIVPTGSNRVSPPEDRAGQHRVTGANRALGISGRTRMNMRKQTGPFNAPGWSGDSSGHGRSQPTSAAGQERERGENAALQDRIDIGSTRGLPLFFCVLLRENVAG